MNAICPGWIRTDVTGGIVEMIAKREGLQREQARTRLTRHVPLQRMAEPEELAAVCLFLASSQASFVAGAVLIADGGAHVVEVGTLAFD